MGRAENLAVSAVLLAVLYLSAFVLPMHSQPSWDLALSAFALLVAFSVWALAILFTWIVGALLYYFLIKRATTKSI